MKRHAISRAYSSCGLAVAQRNFVGKMNSDVWRYSSAYLYYLCTTVIVTVLTALMKLEKVTTYSYFVFDLCWFLLSFWYRMSVMCCSLGPCHTCHFVAQL